MIPYSERYIKIAKNISNFDYSKLLDIGSRNGILKSFLNYNCKYYGIDLNPQREDILKIDINKEKIPFPDNYFDYVVCSEVLEHLSNHDNALSEIFRVLKPNGKFIGTVPNSNSIYRTLNVIFNRNHVFTEDHFCSYDLDEIKRLIEKYGFKCETSNFHYVLPKFGEIKILEKIIPRCSTYIFFNAIKV